MRDDTLRMLKDAGLDNPDVLAKANPKRVRMAVGRDEERIKEIIVWLTDGDPGRAYARTPEIRPLLDGLRPGLKELWSKLKPEEDPEAS